MTIVLAASIYYKHSRQSLIESTIKYLLDIKSFLSAYNINSIKILIANTGDAFHPECLSQKYYSLCNSTILNVDNELHEFSAYRAVCSHLVNSSTLLQSILLINDTVPVKRYYEPYFLSTLIAKHSRLSHQFFDVLSRRDISLTLNPGFIQFLGRKNTTRFWYSSHFFVLSPIGLEAMNNFFHEVPYVSPLLLSCQLSPKLYSRIYSWINGTGLFKWASSSSIGSLTSSHINTKIQCCYLELSLYIYLRRQALVLFKFNIFFFLLNRLSKLKKPILSFFTSFPIRLFISKI